MTNVDVMVARSAIRPRAGRSLSARELTIGVAVAVSLVITALCGGTLPLAVWVGTLAFVAFYGGGSLRAAIGPLLIAVWMFYPDAVAGMSGLALNAIFETLILVSVAVLVTPGRLFRRQTSRIDHFLVVGWVGWGLLAYAPVLVGYVSAQMLGTHGIVFEGVPNASSGIKTVFPVLGAVLAAKVGSMVGDGPQEARVWRRATIAATVIAVVLALGLFALRVDLASYWEGFSSTPGRLHNFSSPDANNFGRSLLMPVLLMSSWIFFGSRRLWRTTLIALLIAMTAVLLTQSRTTYLSVLIGFGILSLLAANRFRFWLFAILAAGGLTGIFFATGLNLVFSAGGERASSQNLESRIQLWKGVIEILRAHPWFGAHPTGYTYAMWSRGLIPEGEFIGAHNVYLWLGAEFGIPMALLTLLVLFRSGWHGWRAWRLGPANIAGDDVRPLGAFVLASSVAYLVHGVTETVPPAFLFFLLGLSCAIHQRAIRRAGVRIAAAKRKWRVVGAGRFGSDALTPAGAGSVNK